MGKKRGKHDSSKYLMISTPLEKLFEIINHKTELGHKDLISVYDLHYFNASRLKETQIKIYRWSEKDILKYDETSSEVKFEGSTFRMVPEDEWYKFNFDLFQTEFGSDVDARMFSLSYNFALAYWCIRHCPQISRAMELMDYNFYLHDRDMPTNVETIHIHVGDIIWKLLRGYPSDWKSSSGLCGVIGPRNVRRYHQEQQIVDRLYSLEEETSLDDSFLLDGPKPKGLNF